MGSFEEITIEEAKQLFETNFFGALCMSEAVLPILGRQGYGRIINIGSAAGFTATPYQAIYSASKHAISFSESLDREVRQFGIRVSVIEPGFTRTHIDQNAPIARTLVASLRGRSRSRDQCHPQKQHQWPGPRRCGSRSLEGPYQPLCSIGLSCWERCKTCESAQKIRPIRAL